VKNTLPNNKSFNFFAYYGETNVCMPRLYLPYGEKSWEFTTSLITFNFLCFLFIAVSYFVIYKHSTTSATTFRFNRHNNQTATMQKRVARIIATDFCCWILICIMANLRLVVEFSDIPYQISAVLLLPIYSLINPFLFSSLPDKIINWFRRGCKKIEQVYVVSVELRPALKSVSGHSGRPRQSGTPFQ